LGALTLNTFLGLNPKIADKISGVFYTAPLFGTTIKYNMF